MCWVGNDFSLSYKILNETHKCLGILTDRSVNKWWNSLLQIFVDVEVHGYSESNLKLGKRIISQDIPKIANQHKRMFWGSITIFLLLQLFPRYVSPDGHHHKQDAHLVEPLLIQYSCSTNPSSIYDEKLTLALNSQGLIIVMRHRCCNTAII